MKSCLIATALTILGCLAVPTPGSDGALLDGHLLRLVKNSHTILKNRNVLHSLTWMDRALLLRNANGKFLLNWAQDPMNENAH